MANIIRHISHLKSSGGTAPAAGVLIPGEIAVGYKAGDEALYIENSNNEVIEFKNSSASIKEAKDYTDKKSISKVTGDSEITVTLSNENPSGRTLTVTHASGSQQRGFKNLSTDSYGHVTGATAVVLSDLTDLGALSGVTGENGISASTRASGNQKVGLATVAGAAGTYKQVVVDSYGRVTSGNTDDDNTFREIKVNGTSFLASSTTTALNLSAGTNVSLTTGSAGLVTIAATDTTYTAATAAPNNVATTSSVGTSEKYAREDHTHAIALATGDANGQVKIAGTNVSVKGLGNAAYLNTGTTAGTVATGNHTHSNMVTGSSLTANNIIVGNGNSAIKNSGVSIETAVTVSSDSVIPTSKAIATYVTEQMTSALTYKGSISSNDTLKPPYKTGDVWVVSVDGTYAGKACEVGDYLIANKTVTAGTSVTNADWDAINGENQVDNKAATLAWNSAVTIATIDGTNITAKLPANPNTNTWRNVKVNGTEKLTTATTSGSLDIASGSANGTISVAGTDVAVTGLKGAAYLDTGTTSNTVAAGNHTHATTIASDTGTSQLTMAFGGKYKLTAGGNSYIFTMPSSASTWTDNYYINGASVTTAASKVDVALSGNNSAAKASFTIPSATTSAAGVMTSADKTKLNGIATGAEVNQNAFSNVKVGDVTIAADGKTDTVEFVATNTTGTNGLTITGDATNDKVTFNLGDVTCGDYA